MTELFPWLFGGGTILLTIVIIFCSTLPFLLIFGWLGYYFYKKSKMASEQRKSAQFWVQTTGVVMQSRVEVTGGETASVNPRVIYQFQVAGQTYQSDQIRAGDHVFRISGSGDAYTIVDKYPIGANVVVFYNPANPAESALER